MNEDDPRSRGISCFDCSFARFPLAILALAGLMLAVGCRSSLSGYAGQISAICPPGWQVSTSTNLIVLQRTEPVYIMGYISRQGMLPGQSKSDYFRQDGAKIQMQLRLRFVPRLSPAEYARLKTVHESAAAAFVAARGASGKVEYDQWIKRFEETEVPIYFNRDCSIFIGRCVGEPPFAKIEPRFVEVFPPEAASEIEGVIKSLKRLFDSYGYDGS